MTVETYDPGEVTVIWGGVILDPPSGQGVMVRVERNNPQANRYGGTGGSQARAIVRDKSGRVTVRTHSASDQNDQIAIQAQLDTVPGGGDTHAILVRDSSGRSLHAGENAWLMQIPTEEFDDVVSTIEWVFEVANLDMFIGGN